MENIIRSLYDDGIEYIEETVREMSLYARQIFFVNCMKIIDKSYYDYVMLKSDESAKFFFEILRYAYPVLIKYLWTKDFESIVAMPLAHADANEIYRCRVFLCSCKVVGQTGYALDMEKYGYVSIDSKNNTCIIKYLHNNWWVEYSEAKCTDFNENLIYSLIQLDDRVKTLQAQWPMIQEEMRPLCFVWLKEFMGYTSTANIEKYFGDTAYYDAIHSTEWNYFSEQSKFDGIAYGSFISAIIDLSGYAAKHIHFAGLLQSSHPELIAENLFYNIKMEDDIIQLIQENRRCSKKQAQVILSSVSISSDNSELYNLGQVSCAPLVKISRNQYLQSVAGSLFHPFSFLQSSLQQKFPNDFSRNINNRESMFREELYETVGAEFTCIDHNIVVKYDGKVVTDIDAAIVDKNNGEIALFQLKWQNQTVDSVRSLHSKALNYEKETIYWVESVERWLEQTSKADIAGHLGSGIKEKDIDKSKIFLFVLGRNHGHYSGTQLKGEKVVWVQWFQLLQYFLMMKMMQEKFTIKDLYDVLPKNAPANENVKREPQEYSIGPYTIVVEGTDNEE